MLLEETSLQIIRHRSSDLPEYRDFLARLGQESPSVLAYHDPRYLAMLSSILNAEECLLVAKERNEGRVVAALPGLIKRSAIGSVYNSLPFFGPNAGVLSFPRAFAREAHASLLEASLEIARSENAWSAVFYTPFLFSSFDYYDDKFPDGIVLERFTQYLSVEQARSWSAKMRWDVNRAKSQGVRVVRDDDDPRHIESFWEIYRENCRDYGIPEKPKKCLRWLLPERGSLCDLYLALLDDEVIAGVLVLWGKMTASYYLPCTRHSYRSLQPSAALIDAAISDAAERQIRFWNWESSPSRDSGVYKFKKKWGSLEASYRVYVQPMRREEEFRSVGKQALAENFPYFFVYPFQRLEAV